ncbi:MAG: 4Fe-4S dicluster domain-containing protein [Planctomycetes bacterium]|nr:4Fe-4S dicluster domain-containing protein [Planctomycetota bacterium]
MLFRTLAKAEFRKLVELLLAANEVVGPKRVGTNVRGEPLHQFLPVSAFDELALDYANTEFPPKTYFLPYREDLCSYRFGDDDWTQDIRYQVHPRVIVGMHACDINGLVKLDKVFTRDTFPSPYYLSRRKNTLIIGIDHLPGPKCFCRSVGADLVERGFDLFLSDLDTRYFVAIGSDRGFGLLQRVDAKAITDEDRADYLALRHRIADAFETHVDVQNLPSLLDIEFESKLWKKWGDKCLSCGACAMVCPTCYCYGVHERVSIDFRCGAKVKQLHSCNLLDFAMVAGNHNFRPTRESRLKYRYYHQHRGFVEAYDEPNCVGCNRCGHACLVGINPPDVIADLQAEERR